MRYDDFRRSDNIDDRRDDDGGGLVAAAVAVSAFRWAEAASASARSSCSA